MSSDKNYKKLKCKIPAVIVLSGSCDRALWEHHHQKDNGYEKYNCKDNSQSIKVSGDNGGSSDARKRSSNTIGDPLTFS